MTDTTPAAELRAAAQRLRDVAPQIEGPLAGLADPVADWLESDALTVDAVAKHRPDAVIEGENAHWLAPALAVARQINGTATTIEETDR